MYKKSFLASLLVTFVGAALLFTPSNAVFGSHSPTTTDSSGDCSTDQAVCSVNGYTYESECMAQE
ncbi:MAG: hypothetical protein ABEJ02_01695, partial [Candidatus Paceibacteria bacterium]